MVILVLKCYFCDINLESCYFGDLPNINLGHLLNSSFNFFLLLHIHTDKTAESFHWLNFSHPKANPMAFIYYYYTYLFKHKNPVEERKPFSTASAPPAICQRLFRFVVAGLGILREKEMKE